MKQSIQNNNLFKIKSQYELEIKYGFFVKSAFSLLKDYCEAFDFLEITGKISFDFNDGKIFINDKEFTKKDFIEAIVKKSREIYENDSERIHGEVIRERLSQDLFRMQENQFIEKLGSTLPDGYTKDGDKIFTEKEKTVSLPSIKMDDYTRIKRQQ